MKVAASLLAAVTFAIETGDNYDNGKHQPAVNEHFDNTDASHQHYGGDQAASPAYPAAPDLHQAVDAFDTYGTLFGEHRYQLQVAKTGNMLIGTEALRESIAGLQYRIHHARQECSKNDQDIDRHDLQIDWNRNMISDNRDRMYTLDGKVHDLESGYAGLSLKLGIDREAVIMMCHQYAYAEKLPKECQAILGGLTQPIDYAWNWPDIPCNAPASLPPFAHEAPHYDNPHDAPVTYRDDSQDSNSHY